jgi:hypothetical protein
MKQLITMRDALARPEYFADQLGDASWLKWRVLLIAIAGEQLTPDECKIFTALTGLPRPPADVSEFWAIHGGAEVGKVAQWPF